MFEVLPDKFKINSEKVGLKEVFDNRYICCQKLNKELNRSEHYTSKYFDQSEVKEIKVAQIKSSPLEHMTIQQDKYFCRFFL